MNRFLQTLRNVLFPFWLAICLNIISWLIVYFKIRPSSENIPLQYNVFYGTVFADKGYFIYIIPAIGLLMLAVDYLFFRYSFTKEPFAAKTMLSVGLVVQIFILIAILFLQSIIVI